MTSIATCSENIYLVEQYVQNLLNYTTVSNFNAVIVKRLKYEIKPCIFSQVLNLQLRNSLRKDDIEQILIYCASGSVQVEKNWPQKLKETKVFRFFL